jgi:hypothetical protein
MNCGRPECQEHKQVIINDNIQDLNIHKSEFNGFYRIAGHLYILYDYNNIMKFEAILREYHIFAMYYTRFIVRHIITNKLDYSLAAQFITDINFLCEDNLIDFPDHIITFWRETYKISPNKHPY